RVDFLGGAGEPGDGAPGGGRGRGDRRAGPEVGRAPTGGRRAAGGRAGHGRGTARLPGRPGGALAAAGELDLHPRGAQDERRQVRQEAPTQPALRRPTGDPSPRLASATLSSRLPTCPQPTKLSTTCQKIRQNTHLELDKW